MLLSRPSSLSRSRVQPVRRSGFPHRTGRCCSPRTSWWRCATASVSPPMCIGPHGTACRSPSRCRSCCSAPPTASRGRGLVERSLVLRRARLRGGPAGHAGTVRVGRHVLEVPRPRCPGRLRYGRVGRRASLHVGRRRHVRHLLRRAHAGGRGQDEPAAPAGAAAQPGRHLPPVGAQGPQPRRVRAGPAARLGVRPAPRLARPGGASHVRGGGGGRLVRGDAPAAGPQPPRRGAGVRGLRAHPDDARGRRRPGRRLPALGPHRRELAPLLRAHGRRADAARRRLVRPLLRQHVRELPGAVGRQDRAAAAARRALDARREHPLPRRRRRLRSGRGAARFRQRAALAVVRPPSERTAHRSRRMAAHPPVRNGHGGRRQGRERPVGGTAATGATRRSGRCRRRNRPATTSTRTGR